MNISLFCEQMEKIAPKHLAMPDDRIGLLIGTDRPVILEVEQGRRIGGAIHGTTALQRHLTFE